MFENHTQYITTENHTQYSAIENYTQFRAIEDLPLDLIEFKLNDYAFDPTTLVTKGYENLIEDIYKLLDYPK